jgi:hypothetical protein
MPRLSRREQAEYEEEANYSAETGATRYPARSAYSRAREAAEKIAGYGRQAYGAGQEVHDAFARAGVYPVYTGVREYAGRMNVSAPPKTARSRAYYAAAPVNQTSAMHPGNSIIVMQGRVLASTQTARQAPRQPPRRPAFGFDDGM